MSMKYRQVSKKEKQTAIGKRSDEYIIVWYVCDSKDNIKRARCDSVGEGIQSSYSNRSSATDRKSIRIILQAEIDKKDQNFILSIR